ncbi:hypothetical protein BK665_02725 [Pseudomonas frederiksbergensis]|uniref:Uncharacterized protein n=1 Tax=Pseudomonas frederiksbergensis TaxID=104087 RepID=A0A423KR04_9PSED|nr:hypothetical protein BK665_02725 [Pseudomonas frederiksbergensis]
MTVLLASLVLSGCSTPPKILYTDYKNNTGKLYPDYEGLVKYNLAASILLIKEQDNEIKIASIPVESDKLLVLHPADTWGVTTHLKVAKIPNTNLLKQVDIEVEDKRKAIIEQIGSAGAALVGALGIASATGVSLPLAIDTQVFLQPPKPEALTVTGSVENPSNAFDMKIDPVPIGSIPYDDFIKKASVDKQSVLAYSACRHATVTITVAGSKMKFSTIVADPNFVQLAALPTKGSVTMHSECGVDTSDVPGSASTSTELISTFINQAKAVRDARPTK